MSEANGTDAAAAFRAAETVDEREHWASEKEKQFVLGGLRDPTTQEYRPIEALPVGKVTGEKLRDCGFNYAYQLIGQYMVNSMDDEATDFWLENEIRIKRPDLRDTVISAMRRWCDWHL